MPKQNYTVRLLIFMIFCAFMYGVLLVVWAAILPAKFAGNVKHPLGGGGHLHTRLAEVQDHAPVDILFLGSSLAYRGFDTRIWKERGYTAFNLGSSAQSPVPVSYTHLRAHETVLDLVCRLLLEKKKTNKQQKNNEIT